MFNTKELIVFIKQPLIKRATVVFVGFFLISLALIAWQWSSLPPQVPLYYSLPWGEQRLAAPWELTLLPTMILSIFITNLLTAFLLVRDNELMVKALIFTSLFVAGLLSYSLIRIVFLVS